LVRLYKVEVLKLGDGNQILGTAGDEQSLEELSQGPKEVSYQVWNG